MHRVMLALCLAPSSEVFLGLCEEAPGSGGAFGCRYKKYPLIELADSF